MLLLEKRVQIDTKSLEGSFIYLSGGLSKIIAAKGSIISLTDHDFEPRVNFGKKAIYQY